MSGDTNVLYKMKALWISLGDSFTNPQKYLKKIRKSDHLSEYMLIVDALFREQELVDPGLSHPAEIHTSSDPGDRRPIHCIQ